MSEESVQPSFREQAMTRLAEERGARVEQPAPENVQGTAPEEIDDAVIEEPGTPESESTDGILEEEAAAHDQDDDVEPQDETPDEVEHDWQKRYKDAQAELTRLQQSREEFEGELTHQLTEVKRREYELEDTLVEARGNAELLLNALKGQADRYRNVDLSTIPADQLPQWQQQAAAAFQHEQQVMAALNHIKEQHKNAHELQVKREADLALTRLRRTIPGWSNDKYRELGEYAKSRGLDPTLFNAVTNPAVIEMFHDSMMYRQAGSKAKTVSKQKMSKPANANSPTRVRDARGKFVSAKQAFEQAPNERGAFAKMKEAQLAMERR